MRRRRLLKATASTTALAAFAGCTQTGDRSTDDPADTTEEPTDGPGSQPGTTTTGDPAGTGTPGDEEPTGTETSEPDGSPGSSTGSSDEAWGSGGTMNGVQFSFTSQSPECATGEAGNDDVDISFDDDAGEVVLDGVISGSDTCKRAQLDSVDHDEEDSELTVVVGTTDRSDCENGVGAQCIVDIEYDATFTFDDVPKTVSVSHDGHGDGFGATASHNSVSASDDSQ